MGLAQCARHAEQHQRLFQRDRVDALAGHQRREQRLVLVLDLADLHQRAVLADARADLASGLRIGAEHAHAAGVGLVQRFLLVVHQRLERRPEPLHQRDPVLLATAHRIQLVLELGGEVVIDVLREVARQELRHRAAHVARAEAAALELDVLAEQQRLDDRRVRRRPADAVFLQRLDQRGFSEARRRLGEVLFGKDAVERNPVARLHQRQLAALVVILGALLVLAFLIHGEEAGVDDRRARCAEAVFAAGGQVDRDRIHRRRHHLRGDRALPHQVVELARVVVEEPRHLRGRAQRGRGTHGFVRFLRVLALGLVDVGLVGQRAGAEVARDDVAQFAQRIDRQVHRVGAHVADQADGAFLADVHAFVELLRDLHRAARGEAELARGLLLQRRGGERRCRPALALLAGDVGDLQRAAGGGDDALARVLGGVAVGDGELLEFRAVQFRQPGGEGLRGMRARGFDRPVLARDEGFDFFFALDDHAQRRRLHAAGREPALHLAPQHRRQVEPDEVVQRTPRLLRIDQVAGDLARLGHRLLDRARRDLGEHHAVQRLVADQVALAQDLRDVPADRLALAVRVGRQIEVVGALGRLGDGLDMFLVLLDQVVAHREAVFGVDRALLGHQVTDMAVGGEDGVVLAEVLVDRLGLGGRLDDHEVLGHGGELRNATGMGASRAPQKAPTAANGRRRAGDVFFSGPVAGSGCQAPLRVRPQLPANPAMPPMASITPIRPM